MKKTRLVIEYDYDFVLLGITSSVKFYKLAWSVNKALGINLVRIPDYELPLKEETQAFGCYVYGEEEPVCWLFKNRSLENEKHYLAPEYAHFDYLLKFPLESQSFAQKEILQDLREVKCIEYIGAIEIDTMKSRDNFLD
jgi:hypothetical protein